MALKPYSGEVIKDTAQQGSAAMKPYRGPVLEDDADAAILEGAAVAGKIATNVARLGLGAVDLAAAAAQRGYHNLTRSDLDRQLETKRFVPATSIERPQGEPVGAFDAETGQRAARRDAAEVARPAQAPPALFSVTNNTPAGEKLSEVEQELDEAKTPGTRAAFREVMEAGQGEPSELRAAYKTVRAIARNPLVAGEMLVENAGLFVPTMAAQRIVALPTYRRTFTAVLDSETKKLVASNVPKEVAEVAARQTATIAARNEAIRAGAQAGLWTEVGMGAAFAGDQASQTIMAMDPKVLAKSPAYQELVEQGVSEEDARIQLANEARLMAGPIAGAATGLASKLSGAISRETEIVSGLGMATRGVLGGVLRFGSTVGRETAEEAAQEAGEQVSSNIGATRALGHDVTVAGAAEGAGSAAALGGTLGAAAGSAFAGAEVIQRAMSEQVHTAQPSSRVTSTSPAGKDTGAVSRPISDEGAATIGRGAHQEADIGSALARIERDKNEDSEEAAGRDSSARTVTGGDGSSPALSPGSVGAAAPSENLSAAAEGTGAIRPIPDAGGEQTPALEAAANEAATSPRNDLPDPSDAQKEAGNYRKGHVKIQGLDISIENPAGSRRRPEWGPLKDHYGYIRGTKGRDKEHIDVFVGADTDSPVAYVVDQIDPETGNFDEHKIILGQRSLKDAREAYQRNYQADWKGLGNITAVPVRDLREWLRTPQTKPFAKATRLKVLDDKRLADPLTRQQLSDMAPEAGWFQVGGKVQRSGDGAGDFEEAMGRGHQHGDIIGRTSWVPNAPWFPEVQQRAPLPGNTRGTATLEAVQKALDGRQMTAPERAHVRGMLEHLDELRRDYEAHGAADVDPFDLTGEMTRQGLGEADVNDAAVVARAVELDEAAVEQAAKHYEADDRGFMQAVRRIVDGRGQQEQGQQARGDGQGRQGAQGEEGGAGVAGQPGQAAREDGGQVGGGPRADGGTGLRSAPESDAGSRDQGAVPGADRVAGRDQESGTTGLQDRAVAAAPALELEAQTEADLTARAERTRAAEAQEKQDAAKAEERARADVEASDFRLTGSDRPADVAMAGGQADLIGAAQRSPDRAAIAEGVKPMVQREQAAASRFIDAASEQFGITAEEARRAMDHLVKTKMVSLGAVDGQFKLKDGRVWNKEILRRAADLARGQTDPLAPPSSGSVNEKPAAPRASDRFNVRPAAQEGWMVVEDPRGDGTGQALARFRLRPDGGAGKIQHYFESPSTRGPVEEAVDRWNRERTPKELTKEARAELISAFEAAPVGSTIRYDGKVYERTGPSIVWRQQGEGLGTRGLVPSFFVDHGVRDLPTPPTAAAPAEAATTTPIAATEQPEAATAGAVLRIEPFGSLIAVRGDTKPNKDRIKAVGGAIWNRKAEAWTFKKEKEPALRAALADLLEPGGSRQFINAAPAGATLESSGGKGDGKPENAAEPEGLQGRDGGRDRADGRTGEPDRGPLGGRLAEAGPEARKPEPAPAGDQGADGTGTARPGPRGAEPVDGGDRDAPDGRRDGRPAGIVDEPAGDHVISDQDQVGEGGEKAKARANLAAIELVKRLESEGRSATLEERRALARYVGWGGLKAIFDPQNSKWSDEHLRLTSLLSAEEFAAARASMLDAHYTSLPVVDAMWEAAEAMGFTGGRVLEPSMGVGNFFGRMPEAVRARSVLNGVELDRITGLIAKQLYQRADIAVATGFQDVTYPENSADLVIGNPPFGSQVLYDASMPTATRGFSIHNFFFAKAVQVTRPGGLITMVVSHNLMDQVDASARQWIAERAHLRGAIRLPYTAFLSNAGTEVVTDVLFLQKAMPGEKPDTSWVETKSITLEAKDGTPREFNVSSYFLANPRMVLGRQEATGKMYGRPDQYNVAPTAGSSLDEQFRAAAIAGLPEKVYVAAEKPVDVAGMRDAMVPETTKVYGYFMDKDGETVLQRVADTFDGKPQSKVVEFTDKTSPRRAAGMVKVKEALRELMRAEMTEGTSNAALGTLRQSLNTIYDGFVKQYGYINAATNRRAFRDDPDLPLLESLEPKYDPGISKDVAKKRDVEARPASAGKADIFKKRVLQPTLEVTSVSSAKDALIASLNTRGRVDPDYMAGIYGKDFDTIADELGDLVFRDPDGGTWQPADVYLSGNVKHKLKVAKAAAAKSQDLQRNVTALEAVQPVDVPAIKIGVRLGSSWLPPWAIRDFAKSILGNGTSAYPTYVRAVGRWSITIEGADQAASISRWGTARVPAVDVMSAVMNNKQIIVKDNVGTSREPVYVVNEAETEMARARADDMAAKFREWIWQDEKRRTTLERIYNDDYNTDRRRTYDGSHLTLPGSSPAIQLRPHQKSGIWRGVIERAELLDHVVGAGKTFEMAGIAMELRRLGIARKPMFTVPNHLVRQWRDEIYKLYPNANVLAATEADFEKANRKRLFGRIATGDWDAVIVGHSSFQRIGTPSEMEKQILAEQLEEITQAIEAIKRDRGDRHVIRDMERIKQNLAARMKLLAESAGKKDDVVSFDEIGVDALFVDEAHLFKNLFYMSQMRGIAGMGSPAGSGRAFDLFVKTQYLNKRYREQARIVFATGTPVSNSLVEMYTMQRYLAWDELKRRGISTLDAWAGVYGDVQNVYEVHPSGTGYRLKSRFAKFVNLPSLMDLYRSVADVVTMQDLKDQAKAAGGRFPVPNVKGGKPKNVVADRSPQQIQFFGVPEFKRDRDNEIMFKTPSDLRPEERVDGKWWLVGSPYYPVKGVEKGTQYGGPYESEAEAKEQAAILIEQPIVQYNEGSILWKFEHLRELTKTTKGKVNALSVTNEARKAGLDYRLIDPAAPDFPGSKINQSVVEMKRIYDEWSADKGTQLVFCDLSTPQSARASAATKEKVAYVRDGDGEIKRVKATVAPVDGYPVAFLVVKEKAGQYRVHDGLTGADLRITGTTRDEAVAALKSRVGTGTGWIDDLRTKYGEIDEDAISEFKAARGDESADDGEEDNTITLGDLLALGGSGKFSVYDDVRTKLVKAGIPDNEIAFIHDYDTAAKKAALFRDVRSGAIRILLGSTEKMGAGTNVQERVVALHHLDAPWRPSDLEQREGRVIRQGNMLYERDPDGFAVEIFRYATKQTYDTRMWQLIEHKAAGIEQLRKADADLFEIDDVGGEESNAADMKAAASGNPLILEEIKLRNEVNSLEAQQYGHTQSLIGLQDRIRRARAARPDAEKLLARLKPFIETNKLYPADADFSMRLASGKVIDDKAKAAEPFMSAFKRVMEGKEEDVVIGEYRGVGLTIDSTKKGVVAVTGNVGDRELHIASYTKDDSFSVVGLFTRVDNLLKSAEYHVAQEMADVERYEAAIPGLEEEAKKPFAKTEELQAKRVAHRNVTNQLAKAGGSIALTPPMQRELKRAIAKRLGKPVEEPRKDVSAAARPKSAVLARSGLSARGARAIAEEAYGAEGIGALVRHGVLEFVDGAGALPASLQDFIERFELDNPGREVAAVTDHALDRVFIIADRARASDIPALVMHEIGEHYGLPKMLGQANYNRLLTEVRAMHESGANPLLDDAWRYVETHYGSLPTGSEEFLSEVLARVSERAEFRATPLWRRLLSAVRQFLFRIGFTRAWKLKPEDLGIMVAAALRRSMLPGSVVPKTAPDRAPALAAAGAAPVYYSQLEQVVRDKLPNKGGAKIFRSMIEGWQRKGDFKKEEIEWSGLLEWLDQQDGKLEKPAVLEFLRANGVQVEEVVKHSGPAVPQADIDAARAWLVKKFGDPNEDAVFPDWRWEDAAAGDHDAVGDLEGLGMPDKLLEPFRTAAQGEHGPQYSTYQLGGGDNYREILLTLPPKDSITQVRVKTAPGWGDTDGGDMAVETRGDTGADFRSGHWREPNVLVHVRTNERTDADGKRVLFIEEVQSDWHQQGRRKGYNTPLTEADKARIERIENDAVRGPMSAADAEWYNANVNDRHLLTPNAPFKTVWPMLAMRRMIRWAAEHGFDRIAWTTGEQQAERYNLSKHIDQVIHAREDDGTYSIGIYKNGRAVPGFDEAKSYSEADVASMLGKELAQKIVNGEGKPLPGGPEKELTGLDLKFGGEGMRAFYDRELVNEVGRYVKKWGTKVGVTRITTDASAERFAGAMLRDGKPRPGAGQVEVHSVDITPEMRAGAARPQPMFAVKPTQQQAALGGGSKQQQLEDEAWRKAGMPRDNRSLADRLEHWGQERWATIKEELIDNFQTGVFDRFKPIKDAEGVIDPARSGYLSARLSTGGSSVLYAMMLYGAPEMRRGIIQKKEGTHGLLEILSPVGNDLNRWAAWMVGKRADMLADQHRENNLTLEEIAYLKSLAGPDEEKFESVAQNVRAFMTDVLGMMKSAGLLVDEQVEAFSKDAYYLPFYRIDEDGDATRPFTKRGLSHQSSGIKRLKGGALALNDPIENLFAHLSKAVDASMKNYALARVISNTTKHMTTAKEGDRAKAIRVMWDGKELWFNVDEPALLRALTAVGEKPRDGIALNIGRTMRWLLTTGVTLDPAFMLRNFMRDSMHSWMIDKNSMRFGIDSLKGAGTTLDSIAKTARGRPEDADPALVSMMFAGASFVGGHVYGTDPKANAAAMRKALRRKGLNDQQISNYMGTLTTSAAKFASMYTAIGEAIENANRIATFKAAQDAGQGLAHSLYEGKDLMDYSLRGQWAMVQVMADVLPFFNARLQGLYKLGREARRDPKVLGLVATRIAARGALMALAATALVAAYSGQDRYEELEEWDKDANWHFWVGDTHYRVPKPFELGILFGTIPERMYRLVRGYDRFGEFVQSGWHNIVTTLAFDIRPQALRPAIEIFNNFSSFRQRPIESMADLKKLPEDRYGSHTSPTMVEIGRLTGASPKKLEYAWDGYLGTVGSYCLGIADSMVRVARGDVTPTRRIEDYPIIGSFIRTGPAWNTEYQTELYELVKKAEQVNNSIRDKSKVGDDAAADRMVADYEALLAVRKMLNRSADKIGKWRKQRDAIYNDPEMSAEDKRLEIDQIQIRINEEAMEAVRDAEAEGAQ